MEGNCTNNEQKNKDHINEDQGDTRYIKQIPPRAIRNTLIIDGLVFVVWTILIFYFNCCNGWNIFVQTFPVMVGALASFSVAVFGVTGANAFIYNSNINPNPRKGGNKYYPQKYGRFKIRKIFDRCQEQHSTLWHCEYPKVYQTIQALVSGDSPDNPRKGGYWETVYFLQKTEPDFVMVWNDREFYNCKEYKTPKEILYFQTLGKYIYIAVYVQHEHNINQPKSS